MPKIIQARAPNAPPRSYSSLVVKMAKREEELKEIRSKTTEELQEEIVDLKGELFMLRLQRSARNEFKSSEFLRMRKRVLSLLSAFAVYIYFLMCMKFLLLDFANLTVN